jgi:hypothetical protein
MLGGVMTGGDILAANAPLCSTVANLIFSFTLRTDWRSTGLLAGEIINHEPFN